MAKGKSTWKYNKLLTARRNYYNIGGFFNKLSGNPDSTGKLTTGAFKGMTSAGSGLMDAAGQLVGQIGGPAISGGLESGAGNVIGGLSKVASAIPGPWGAVTSAGLGLVGGLTNRMFGSKLNQENIAAIEGATARANSVRSDAASFDTLANIMSNTSEIGNFSNSYIGKDGWFSNKAKRRAQALREAADIANERQALALLSNAEDIEADTLRNLEANYAAFGGPMDFGGEAIDYDFMNRYLGIKKLAALGKDASLGSLPNSFADGGGIHIKKANRGKFTEYCGGKVTSECIARGKRSSSPAVRKRATFAANARKWKHAFGGDLLTHGANFDTGVTIVGNGGTHEENPNEGVPMGMDNEGTPNLVEEGEAIFNDYVFSNRLKVPEEVRKKYKLKGTKPITFADAARQMSKESEERPNDPISKAGLEDSMMKLMVAQEGIREKTNRNRRYAKGGKLGRLFVGLDTDPYPNMLRRGFAITPFEGPDPIYVIGAGYNSGYNPPVPDRGGNLVNPDMPYSTTPPPIVSDIEGGPVLEQKVPFQSEINIFRSKVDNNKPKSKRVSVDNTKDIGLAPTWMRYVPAYASGIMSLTDALGITNKPDYSEADMVLDAAKEAGTYTPVGFSPIGNYLTYTPFDREFYINQMNAQSGATRRAIMQNASLNRGAGMAALLASDYNTQGQLGQLARQAEEYNLAQRQKVEEFNRATDMFNTEGSLKADMANQEARLKSRDSYLKGTLSAAELRQRERQQAASARSLNLSNFINSFGDIGRENFARNMITTDPSKYYWIDDRGAVYYKGAYDELSTDAKKVNEEISSKTRSNANGGYLTIRKKRR